MFHHFPIRLPILLLALAGVSLSAQTLPRLDGGGAPAAAQPAPATLTPATGWKAATPATTAPATTPLKPLPGTPLAATPATVPAQPPAPADLPPTPATVHFQEGLLSIHTENSSLTQILKDITAKTGMTIEGTPEDERVFGNFGPAPVADVIAKLFEGSNSNFMVFGRAANQAPRSLLITPKTSLSPTGALAANAPAPTPAADDEDDDDPQPAAPIRPLIPVQQQEPPPDVQPQPKPTGIRTPQQILEDMQRRRAEAQQQSQ